MGKEGHLVLHCMGTEPWRPRPQEGQLVLQLHGNRALETKPPGGPVSLYRNRAVFDCHMTGPTPCSEEEELDDEAIERRRELMRERARRKAMEEVCQWRIKYMYSYFSPIQILWGRAPPT